MSGTRNYLRWHEQYDDPSSDLSWRLRLVQDQLTAVLDATAGPVRLVSACAGDGRDVLQVLAARPDANRVTATLIELHPVLAERARQAAATAGLTKVCVRTADAGRSDTYRGAVPADVVLLVGVFGNICDDDLWTTIAATPQLCRAGATALWSRGLDGTDRNERIRARFAETGFTEVDYQVFGTGGSALGVLRYDGAEQALEPDQLLFRFVR